MTKNQQEMSKHKIDDLFKGKLEGHKTSPGSEVWTKLSSELGNKKKAPLLWFSRIAAGIVVVGLITILLLNLDTTEETSSPQLATNEIDTTGPSNSEAGDQIASTNIKEDDQMEFAEASAEAETRASVAALTRQDVSISFTTNLVAELPAAAQVSSNVIRIIPGVSASLLATTILPAETESRTIIYKIGNMNTAIARADTSKESTIKKVWNFTKSLKNGEEKLFNLKEIKNDLFASGKKEKTKNGMDTQIDLR